MRHVSHDFLGVMGINVLEGRTFADTDRAGQPMVMVVNRQFAASGYLGPSPVGKLVFINQLGPWEIVGVVEDVRQYGLDQAAEPQIFLDTRQSPPLPRADGIGPYFVVKTEGDPLSLTSSLRAAIMRVDPESTLVNVATMQQIVSNSISRPRLYASLLGGFAWLAMVLSVIGVYGVMAHTVSQRTREIGVRMALGSSRRRVVRDVLGRVLVTAVTGVLAGVAGAVAMSRFLESMLFGLVPTDPLTFLMVPVIFVAVAGAAALIPLRRAANVDPLVALREP